MHFVNSLYPAAAQMQAFFGATEDGSFVMVNLLKFKLRAVYPHGSDSHLTGAEAYARYGAELAPILANHGARVIYSGAVTGLMIGECDPLWDAVALVEYPSLASFRAMVESAEYEKVAVHRTAGLEGQLNIQTKAPVTNRRVG